MTRSGIILLVILGLAGINYHWYHSPVEISPIETGRAALTQEINSKSDRGEVVEREFFSASEIIHTYSRPLFEENRRKWTPAPLPKPAEIVKIEEPEIVDDFQPDLPNVSIVGISVFPNGAIALIKDKKDNTTKWVDDTTEVQGWHIQDIQADSVEFIQNGHTTIFRLYNQQTNNGDVQ